MELRLTGGLGSAARLDRAAACDEDLVRATIDGDRQAFEVIVRRHQRALVNHLYRQVGQREAALDLAQEVFLKVFVSLGSFDPQYRFTTWLYRIASNRAIDHLRRKRPVTCSLGPESDDGRGEDVERSLPGTSPSPHDMLRLSELQQRIDAAVRGLSPEFRQLILLRHRQNCRYDEIARITNLPIGTVKNRIFRAREALRHALADVLDREEPA